MDGFKTDGFTTGIFKTDGFKTDGLSTYINSQRIIFTTFSFIGNSFTTDIFTMVSLSTHPFTMDNVHKGSFAPAFSCWEDDGRFNVPPWDFPGQNIQSVGIFQYKIFSQYGYLSTKYSVSRDIPVQNVPFGRKMTVQNIVSGGIFQYKMFRSVGKCQCKILVRREFPVQNILFRREIPEQNIQSAGIFQCKINS
jgi:hypothetical protein